MIVVLGNAGSEAEVVVATVAAIESYCSGVNIVLGIIFHGGAGIGSPALLVHLTQNINRLRQGHLTHHRLIRLSCILFYFHIKLVGFTRSQTFHGIGGTGEFFIGIGGLNILVQDNFLGFLVNNMQEITTALTNEVIYDIGVLGIAGPVSKEGRRSNILCFLQLRIDFHVYDVRRVGLAIISIVSLNTDTPVKEPLYVYSYFNKSRYIISQIIKVNIRHTDITRD